MTETMEGGEEEKEPHDQQFRKTTENLYGDEIGGIYTEMTEEGEEIKIVSPSVS